MQVVWYRQRLYFGDSDKRLSPGNFSMNAALKAPCRLSLSRVPDTRSFAFGRPKNDRASRMFRLLT
jgi:hypothetical protein